MPRGTRERLMETAADLFYRNGFQAVGLDLILTRVGITKTAFYKHFESKEDLIVAALDHRDEQDIAESIEFMRRNGGGDPRMEVLAFFDLLTQWFADPDFRGCLFMNAATEFALPTDPIHRAAMRHGERLFAELLLRVRATGASNAEALARQIMLLVSGAISARHHSGVADAAQSARAAAAALLPDATKPHVAPIPSESSAATAARVRTTPPRRR